MLCGTHSEREAEMHVCIHEPSTLLNTSLVRTYFSSVRSWFRVFTVTLFIKDVMAAVGQESDKDKGVVNTSSFTRERQ